MRLSERVYLVGGGDLGFGISGDLDCHVYLVDGGEELALIDAGAGRSLEPILNNICRDGLDPNKLRYLCLTHAHADHSGGACEWHERFGIEVAAAGLAAQYLQQADEERISLAAAKRGGFCPPDYVFRPCPVRHVLADGDRFKVGNLELRALETPGHSSGALSWLLQEPDKTLLFCGDTVFHGGRILVTNVWDCDVPQYARSIGKLASCDVDALLPGHLTIALKNGASHIRKAWESMQRLTMPPNIL